MPLILSFKLALFTLLGTLFLALPIAYWVHFSEYKIVRWFSALLNLPMILPPTVLGFYFLLLFNKDLLDLNFSFSGLVLASVVINIPFMVGPIQNGLDALPKQFENTSFLLGKTKLATFFKVLLPNVWGSVFTGAALTVAHTLGEFGVVFMIGGNLPGKTRLVSLAIYNKVEAMNYAEANKYALILLVISIVVLLSIQFVKGKLSYAGA
jgi:molybdate transport system permease protein